MRRKQIKVHRATCRVNGESFSGTPQQVAEKCEERAEHARLDGDFVAMHTYLQHAEHYHRSANNV